MAASAPRVQQPRDVAGAFALGAGRCLTLTSDRGCFMMRLEKGGAIRTWLAVVAFCSAAAFRGRRQQHT